MRPLEDDDRQVDPAARQESIWRRVRAWWPQLAFVGVLLVFLWGFTLVTGWMWRQWAIPPQMVMIGTALVVMLVLFAAVGWQAIKWLMGRGNSGG